MYKKILAIGAHCDDVELGCSGTLMKMKQQGAEVDIVVSRDDNAPRPSVVRTRETMQKEFKASEKISILFDALSDFPPAKDNKSEGDETFQEG